MKAHQVAEQRPDPTRDSAASSEREAAPSALPAIPNKRYFTIGEVGNLCNVKSHVLRYWEQEFSQLKPIKRRGNRRYYQRHDIELIRLIRTLLYEQGFTIAGARQQLSQVPRGAGRDGSGKTEAILDTRKRIEDEQVDRQRMLQAETAGAEPDTSEESMPQATTRTAPTADAAATKPVAEKRTPATAATLSEVRLALEALLSDLAPYKHD